MEKKQIVAALEEIADLMEILGQNPFRVRSFRNGARAIEGLSEDVGALIQEGTLDDVKGIGTTLVEVITELFETGGSERLEELREQVPPGLVEINAIPGVGPKRALAIHEKLGVSSIADLEKACRDGKVAELPGFGKKSQEKILDGIAYRRQVGGRFLVVEALAAAEPLLARLRDDPGVARVEVAGSLRRRRETIKDIDFIAVLEKGADAGEVMERFSGGEGVVDVVARGETKSSVRLAGGIQADLRLVEAAAYPSALLYFTGSKEHNTVLRGIAREKGYKLNEYGLFKVAGNGGKRDGKDRGKRGGQRGGKETRIRCKDEAAIYRKLGLEWVPPELREDHGEFELARAKKLPELVTMEDIRGVIHLHTTASDGHQTLEEMVDAAREMGLEYLGVTDHSQSAGYAGGLKEADIEKQHAEIDRLNKKLEGQFTIFKGIESDIRMKGALDYPAAVLDRFDFVIASIHSGFTLTAEQQTARVIKAMEEPHTTFLAHPTGRLLLSRDGYPIDMEKVLEAAGRLGVVVEINAHPRRLDLDWRWGNFARRHGVKTSINPDAHVAEGYHHMEHGVGIARKAGFTAAEVVNTLPAKEFAEFVKTRKG